MQLILGALLLALLAGIFWPQVVRWRAASAEERAFTVRFSLFICAAGFLFLGAFLLLPNKGRVVLLLPVFLIAVSLAKWWTGARARFRRAAEAQSSFERARKIN